MPVLNRCYNMDCMEAMRKMPDKCFDLSSDIPSMGCGTAPSRNPTCPATAGSQIPGYGGIEFKRISKEAVPQEAKHREEAEAALPE